jgi:phenylacetate-coenzyme A ligase PaaK-like adenylate-forming protein
MNEKEFEKALPQIKKILSFALSNPYSDFYRRKYKKLDFDPLKISSYEEFKRIPPLKKEEFIDLNIEKRTFVPKENVTGFSFSSGTTNTNKVLVTPHLKTTEQPERLAEVSKLVFKGYNKFLLLLAPTHDHISGGESWARISVIKIIGDIHNLGRTALMSRDVAINGIVTTPTALKLFIPELKRVGFNFTKIRFISLGGEMCSNEGRAHFQDLFPRSVIETRYGSSEIKSTRGYQCHYLYKKPTNFFHVVTTKYFIESVKGEILHTDLESPKAFPMIRYQTGDSGDILHKKCRCGNDSLLILGQRKDWDVLKFAGVTLRADVIRESLSKLVNPTETPWQMHVYEARVGDQLKPRLVLEVTPQSLRDGRLLLNGKDKISKDLFLTATKTLADLVKDNLFLPLEIDIKTTTKKKYKIQKPIISHL